MPSGQFNTVVISVSDILPLDKGHYISVSSSDNGYSLYLVVILAILYSPFAFKNPFLSFKVESDSSQNQFYIFFFLMSTIIYSIILHICLSVDL